MKISKQFKVFRHLVVFSFLSFLIATPFVYAASAAKFEGTVTGVAIAAPSPVIKLIYEKPKTKTIYAWVTGYSKSETCPGDRPCITASGVIAHEGTIACPRRFSFYTKIRIDDVVYECLDRLSQRYDQRFDLWFGETEEDWRAAKAWGRQWKEVIIYE